MFSITDLIVACLICHFAYGLPDTQIIGGKDAPENEYPYQVSLKFSKNYEHFCGGVIIGDRSVITAAHCLHTANNKLMNISEIVIDAGSNALYYPLLRYNADDLIIHPDYNKTRFLNDIALIILTESISFTKTVNKIDLISDDHDFEKSEVIFTVIGWGMTENGSPSSSLKHINLTVYSQEECNNTYKYITDDHICTLQGIGQGTCVGDEGGPLIFENTLAGIVSFRNGQRCDGSYPDVYTKVFPYKGWINENSAGNIQQSNIILGLFITYLCTHLFL